MRDGISRHDSIGLPNAIVGTSLASRCAATESPYGPAPTTAVVPVAGLPDLVSI